MSEHKVGTSPLGELYCCLCFKPLTPEECSKDSEGVKWDVCNLCRKKEHIILALWCIDKVLETEVHRAKALKETYHYFTEKLVEIVEAEDKRYEN